MKLGFIGCGNMAKAIIGGILRHGIASPNEVTASAPHAETREKTAKEFGINTTPSNCEAAKADIVFLAVKPQFYEPVIQEIRDVITPTQLIVSIAPGKSIQTITDWFSKPVKLIRTMPNTPAMVGEGVTALCPADTVTQDELNQVIRLFEACGTAEVMPERLIDGVVAVSGSSPAYIFMIIEAMADGAVRDGIPRAQAYRLAAQSVLGSAKMVLETGRHPGELKDMVCSPAGTTIEAVAALERCGLRSAILEGMEACSRKTRGM